MFAGAEHDGTDRDMHFVDQSGLKTLPDGGDTAAKADVLACG